MSAASVVSDAEADAIETRAAQGLEPGVTDVATLRSLSAIFDPHLKAITAPRRGIATRAASRSGAS